MPAKAGSSAISRSPPGRKISAPPFPAGPSGRRDTSTTRFRPLEIMRPEDHQPAIVEQAADVVDVADAQVANSAAEQAAERTGGDQLMQELAVAARLADGELATGEFLRELERAWSKSRSAAKFLRERSTSATRGDDLRDRGSGETVSTSSAEISDARGHVPLDLVAVGSRSPSRRPGRAVPRLARQTSTLARKRSRKESTRPPTSTTGTSALLLSSARPTRSSRRRASAGISERFMRVLAPAARTP